LTAWRGKAAFDAVSAVTPMFPSIASQKASTPAAVCANEGKHARAGAFS